MPQHGPSHKYCNATRCDALRCVLITPMLCIPKHGETERFSRCSCPSLNRTWGSHHSDCISLIYLYCNTVATSCHVLVFDQFIGRSRRVKSIITDTRIFRVSKKMLVLGGRPPSDHRNGRQPSILLLHKHILCTMDCPHSKYISSVMQESRKSSLSAYTEPPIHVDLWMLSHSVTRHDLLFFPDVFSSPLRSCSEICVLKPFKPILPPVSKTDDLMSPTISLSNLQENVTEWYLIVDGMY